MKRRFSPQLRQLATKALRPDPESKKKLEEALLDLEQSPVTEKVVATTPPKLIQEPRRPHLTVPLDRRPKMIDDMDDEQLARALLQAQKRVDRTKPDHKRYEEYQNILYTVEVETAKRAATMEMSHESVSQPPVPRGDDQAVQGPPPPPRATVTRVPGNVVVQDHPRMVRVNIAGPDEAPVWIQREIWDSDTPEGR